MHGRNVRRDSRTACFTLLVGIFVAPILLSPATALGQVDIPEIHVQPLPDLDARAGTIQPSSAQKSLTASLGAAVTWNRFGTPQSLIKYGGYLATGLTGDPVAAARQWIRQNRTLFRLSDQAVNNLELLNDSKMSGYDGHAVLFRQTFGGVPAAQDGLITVGITGGKIAYVSSSAAGDGNAPGAASLSPQAAWLKAAANVGLAVSPGAISDVRPENSWTIFTVAGFSHPQRARFVAFPTVQNGVRPAYETIVLDNKAGRATAYTVFVDAQSGQVLFRQNAVQRLAAAALAPQTFTFTGTYEASACGPAHGPFEAPAGTTSIDVVASAAIVTNDIILQLHHPLGTVVASSDVLFSPEVIHYAPPVVDPGAYFVMVCPFNPPSGEPPRTYAGTITINDAPVTAFPFPPKWKVFPNIPRIDLSSTDIRRIWCWLSTVGGVAVPGCQMQLFNLAARFPWDQNTRTNTPTFTTIGNAANTAEAWGSPLTPAEPYRPTDPNREYIFPWLNQWQNQKCAQTVFASPNRNDIDPAVANLFAMHNRMHDWSYFLGFTEVNSNAQDNNFGNTAPGPFPTGREFDPEYGDAQAGALSGGPPTYLGRDNANQITLNDGIPPITNMYLWQPIATAFYSPCVDGDFDMSVIGHEYTHLISNRMVGGPDGRLTGPQAGAMGESWSDVNAVEYLREYNFSPVQGENPFAVGPYVTGDKQAGIRNYGMNNSPLNYSDIGYDVTGPQVHADGEIWSAVNFDIRQALVAKYNSAFPASNTGLQRQCADNVLPANRCPGNRRWIQIVHDAFLLMPQNASMVDARQAYLAADVMRFGGANQKQLWDVFAKRGLGQNASSATNADPDPVPSFRSPLSKNAKITFRARAINEGNALINGVEVFVGRYEARATPIAVTSNASKAPASSKAQFVPGTYEFIARANGYGHVRFTSTFTPGQIALVMINMPTNVASVHKGATASGDGVNQSKLIDDTEETNWAALGGPVAGKQVTVNLVGGLQQVRFVRVSAMLRPRDTADPDPATQNRFSALRQFEIWTCTASLANANCTTPPLGFTKVFTSPAAAFPAVAPRPRAPNLIVRTFNVPDVQATHVQLRVVTNQCTGGPDFQGDQDNDPSNNSDCPTGTTLNPLLTAQHDKVRAAELQVVSSAGSANPPLDPIVALLMTGSATAQPGGTVEYEITYSNAGPAPSEQAKITDALPKELKFVSASNGGRYNSTTGKVTWNLGTVPVNATGTVKLTARVRPKTEVGTVIVNQAQFTGKLTTSPPTAIAATLVLP